MTQIYLTDLGQGIKLTRCVRVRLLGCPGDMVASALDCDGFGATEEQAVEYLQDDILCLYRHCQELGLDQLGGNLRRWYRKMQRLIVELGGA